MKDNSKVNLFVVGAMKAGTTSFVDLLSQHPDIYVPPIKEPHYFVTSLPKNLYEPSRFFNLDSYFENDFPKPLHIAKIELSEHYEQLYSNAGNSKYMLDASTAYLHAKEAAQKIYEYNPTAKIAIILRNPLERAYSHYKMDVGLGRINKSFEDVMLSDIAVYKQGSLSWYSYLGMSLYDGMIDNYRAVFTNILIVSSAMLFKDPIQSLKLVSNFLRLDDFDTPVMSQKNKTKTLRFQKVFYLLKQLGLKDYISKLFSVNFRQWIFRRVSKNQSPSIELTAETKKELDRIFKNESKQWYY